jgi:hypothetical protein
VEVVNEVHVVVQELYTNFVLRDIAGKIVPGAFLAFSLTTLFYPPRQILELLTQRVPWHALLLAGGLLWVVVLGLQNLVERIPYAFAYFPDVSTATGGNEKAVNFQIATKVMQTFLATADPADKLQYERFVVIKEATGNLFFALLLAAPLWAHYGWVVGSKKRQSERSRHWMPGWHTIAAAATSAIFYVGLCVGLHGMHAQHVERQFCLAAGSLEDPKSHIPSGLDAQKLHLVCGITLPPRSTPTAPTPPGKASQ